MIETVGLSQSFGSVRALDDVALRVARGTVLGLLGRNGSGKTTLVNILSTLLLPTSGTARVAGFDVVRYGREVRSRIGLTGQYAMMDEQLSGAEHLVMIARLLGAGRGQARQRMSELLELFDLTAVADRPTRTLSGGTRRRLDLAISLVGRPRVLFLDEPTTGLDPESRLNLWSLVEGLVRDGTTVLLTTQYLEEADRLADTIAVLDGGRVLATGPTEQLKADVGVRSMVVTVRDRAELDRAVSAARRAGLDAVPDPARRVVAVAMNRPGAATGTIRALDEAAVDPVDLRVVEPRLEDVYLRLTERRGDRVAAS